jgi:hypothetical protein
VQKRDGIVLVDYCVSGDIGNRTMVCVQVAAGGLVHGYPENLGPFARLARPSSRPFGAGLGAPVVNGKSV